MYRSIGFMSNKSKIIVVTGGSEGLGKAAADEIGCDYFVCDVSDYKQVQKMVEEVINKYGRIDVLVNNAGLWIQGELETNEPDEIKRLIEVNTLGTILFSRAVIPQMKKQKSGLILNVISQAGLYGKAERTVYQASKWAITGFTKSLEMELSKHNIKVTGVYPGMMRTGIFENAGIEKDTTNGLDTKDIAQIIEFILSFDLPLTFPEIGFKHINQ